MGFGMSVFRCLLLLIVCFTGAAGSAQARIWTDNQGRQVEAEMVSVNDEEIVLRKPDGTTATLPLSRLSPEDQEYARGRKEGPLYKYLPAPLRNNALCLTLIVVGGIIMVFSAIMHVVIAFAQSFWWGLAMLPEPVGMVMMGGGLLLSHNDPGSGGGLFAVGFLVWGILGCVGAIVRLIFVIIHWSIIWRVFLWGWFGAGLVGLAGAFAPPNFLGG